MRRRTLAVVVMGLCALASPATADTIYANGAPNGQAGFNIYDDFRAADDFSVAGAIAFDTITFWGLLPAGTPYTPTIFWEILQDDSGLPGTAVALSGSALAQPSLRTSIGAIGFDSWRFDLNVGSQTIGPGTFWLALHDGPIGDLTFSSLLWEGTDAVTGYEAAMEFTQVWAPWGGNFAFELRTASVPEPATLALVAAGWAAAGVAARRKRRMAARPSHDV